MTAVVSDIHSNLEALRAVLADAEQHGATEVVCLGDVVGYGPDPIACLDLAMTFSVNLLGNHDQAALFAPDGFCPCYERATFWTQSEIERAGSVRWSFQNRYFEFFSQCPRQFTRGEFLYVHGSPRNPLNEYVFPEDIYNERKLERIFAMVDVYCFHGHTHVPGIITENREFASPADLSGEWRTTGVRTLVNVGSVGQPRDDDPRACYVLFDGETVRWRRVEYDIDTTVRKIYAIPELENFLGDRLREGR